MAKSAMLSTLMVCDGVGRNMAEHGGTGCLMFFELKSVFRLRQEAPQQPGSIW